MTILLSHIQILADREENLIQIALNQMTCYALICFYLFDEMRHCHFIRWIIAKDSDIYLVGKTFSFQEFRLLYEQNRDPETGRISYAASEPQRMTRGLIVQEVKLPAGTYEIEFVIDDVFNRSMKLDRVEMEWDGEQMKIRTDGWEGSETLDIGKYY